ncbi:TonB-dependent receptor [Sulfurimonas sp. HSL-3221]|uniref:TonB-dependent receptor n=1 Tax=Sulfurimonadaceae TaxID=2771471 RepID=UPI001E557164|nr:TonB-dependent receptor [Sulfurimonas sp. HSL-3221]UFS63134.1 TonB-dependent receptor [Sulfurimonas sp. HSL-3221]
MKKTVLVSLAAAALLANETVENNATDSDVATLGSIVVESSSLSDVNTEEIKSADTAEALAKQVPSITLVRRSGIANDIILRGQKRDNINVIVDGGKIYGACPNRMDPPTSHVITNNIASISIIEGPYDVEHAGTLSGLVTVDTVQPDKGVHGNFNAGLGSFGYSKVAGTLTGGNDTVRALIGVSGEWSGQYEDGSGNTFADQIDNAVAAGTAKAPNAYLPSERDRSAYAKRSVMAKLFVNLAENQELRLGYTGNRSDGVLYPNSGMDARYDNSDLYNVQYVATDLTSWSKELRATYYYSYVDHPMWTEWRKSSMMMGTMTNHLTSTIQGATLKNTTALSDTLDLTLGLDGSLRNWDGAYDMNGTYMGPSINDADTRNVAFFAELEKRYTNAAYKLGLRYDDTAITSGNPALQDNDYTSVGLNLFADYSLTESLGFFGGIGMASRVPDARELYFQKSGMIVGTPDLDQTTNYEADLGMTNTYSNFNLKTRLFYSRLKDYIYYNATPTIMQNKFENIDATIWGAEIAGTWFASDSVYVDFGAAYQYGKKDSALRDQNGTNLADIPPLKGHLALNWNYRDDSLATIEGVAAHQWDRYDAENGEQAIGAWAVMNLKIDHRINRNFGLIAGVDNVFNATYAVSNTYKDLTLLSLDPAGDVMLLNEPGRYFYANVSYKF